MNIGQIISWILSNTGFITSIVQTIKTIAQDLQSLHGNNSLDAYAKAILAAVEGFFANFGANTQKTTAEQQTISGHVDTMPTPPASQAT